MFRQSPYLEGFKLPYQGVKSLPIKGFRSPYHLIQKGQVTLLKGVYKFIYPEGFRSSYQGLESDSIKRVQLIFLKGVYKVTLPKGVQHRILMLIDSSQDTHVIKFHLGKFRLVGTAMLLNSSRGVILSCSTREECKRSHQADGCLFFKEKVCERYLELVKQCSYGSFFVTL